MTNSLSQYPQHQEVDHFPFCFPGFPALCFLYTFYLFVKFHHFFNGVVE